MKLFCETVVKNILPSIRALVAKELIEKYKLTQYETAKKLGVTQGAVSQYLRSIRGLKTKIIEKDKAVNEEIEKFASKIASGEITYKEMVNDFANICKLIVRKKLIIDNSVHSEDCPICFGHL